MLRYGRGAVVDYIGDFDAAAFTVCDVHVVVSRGKQADQLDVLEKEPMAKDNPLAQIKDSTRLIITPHMSWASVESRTKLVQEVYRNIEAFLNGTDRNIVS